MNRLPVKAGLFALAIVIVMLAFSTPGYAQIEMAGQGGQQAGETAPVVRSEALLSVTAARPGESYDAAVVATIQPEWHINSASPYQDWLIPASVAFDTTDVLTPHSVIYPRGRNARLLGETMSLYDRRAIIRFKVDVADKAAEGDHELPIRFTFQPCNDETCLPPETVELNLAVTVGANGVAANSELFDGGAGAVSVSKEAQADDEQPADPVGADNDIQRLIDEYGFLGYFIALGLAFVTGLLLSFSPCTYPMIPITVSIFAGQERTVGRGFILSLFYVGSMAVVYGIMGLIVSLVGGVFGAWLASTPVVIAIAVVFVIFALSMFGLYDLNLPMALRQKLGARRSGGGVIGAIVLGVIAALVVSPCVGPFVAGILLYVATHGSPLIGFVVLFTFALGLGTLFVIIGTFSSAINALPNSGAWMETVKKFFGFVLLLMALYFLRTIIGTTTMALLTGLLLLAFAVFGGGLDRLKADSGFFDRLKKFLGLLALLIGLYLLLGTILRQGLILPAATEWLPAGGTSSSVTEKVHIRWTTDLQTGLDKARAEGKPILIDTWATWCANCRVLEKKTFGHPDVVAEAGRFVPIKVQLETADSPTTKDFMARFGLKHYSLPTTLLLDSSGTVRKVLVGVVGPDEMIAEMQRIE